MSDNVLIALIGLIGLTITTLPATLAAIMAFKLKNSVNSYHHEVNGKMTQLLAAKEEKGFQEGVVAAGGQPAGGDTIGK